MYVETMNSKRGMTSPLKQRFVPTMETISEAWTSAIPPQRNDHLPLQVRIEGVHQALLTSILAIHALAIMPGLDVGHTTVRAQTSSDRSWLLSSILRFWSVAIPHLQESFASSSELNWVEAFLDTIGRFFSSLSRVSLKVMIASKVSSLMSQVAKIFFLRLEATQLPPSTKKSLCAACFEIAFLCQETPKWFPLLIEHVIPTLRKVEAKIPKISGDLGVNQNRGPAKETCAH